MSTSDIDALTEAIAEYLDVSGPEALDIAEDARDLGFRADGVEINHGRRSYIVTDDGIELAEQIVAQDLEDEPNLFTESWLAQFIVISPTDRRLLAQEEADSAAEALDENDLDADSHPDVADALEALEDAENAVHELDEEDFDSEEAYEAALDSAEYEEGQRASELEDARLSVMDELREDWASERAEEIEQALASDPLGYFRDIYGWDVSDIPTNLYYIDVRAAAENAVAIDGAAHFLAHYDGEEGEVEVDGTTFYFYRTN